MGEESDEDEDVVRIQWEGNGNFGKKFSVLSDIDSAESGIPWPILQPPFYYYSSSINDFQRENLSRENQSQRGLEGGGNSGERNRSDSVKKLRIYEITGPERRDGKFGENLGNIERQDSEKIDLESWKNFGKSESENYPGEERNFGKNRSIGNLGEFDNNGNVRKLNENFERKDNFGRWNFGDGNFGKGSSQNFGNQSDNNNENSGSNRNLKVLTVNENFERRNFGNDQNKKFDENLERINFENGRNLKVLKVNENFEHQNFGNDENFKILNPDENFRTQNFDNGQNYKIFNSDKNLENDKNTKFDENLERKNFGIGRNLKVLKIDETRRNNEEETQNNVNFGNKNLKVVKIGENFSPVHVRNFGNNFQANSNENLKNIKAHNVQILSKPRDWFDGMQKSDESDFGSVKKPKNFENNQESDDQNESEETDGAFKSTIWDPSKTVVDIKKLRPVQSLSVIKPLEVSQFPRGNRKYQDSEEMSERRNWEFSRDSHLRRKEFQRVNHFKYLGKYFS